MRFVIYTPHFNENIGGVIVLYELASTLNKLGHTALIWNTTRPHPNEYTPYQNNSKLVDQFKIPIGLGLVDRNSPYNLEHAEASDLDNAIIIYPDTALGNPLGAKRVVRWYLYYPGAHIGTITIGPDDILFFFLEKYIPNFLNSNCVDTLKIHALRHDIYFPPAQDNARPMSSYIIHKGKSAAHIHHPSDAVKLDNRTHTEIADLMRKSKTVYSYDRDTTYNLYALLSGCDVILTPNAAGTLDTTFVSHKHEDRINSAIAHGIDDLPRARACRADALKAIRELGNINETQAQKLIMGCVKKGWA
jgi:hypothetical protein